MEHLKLFEKFNSYYRQIMSANDSVTELQNLINENGIFVLYDFIKNGGDIEMKNEDEETLMVLCSYNGYPYIIKELIKLGANVNVIDDINTTPLIYAASNGYNDIVKMLIKAGANINYIDGDNETALINTIITGFNYRSARILLDAGADVTIYDKSGKTFYDYLEEEKNHYRTHIEKLINDYPIQYNNYLKIKKTREFNL